MNTQRRIFRGRGGPTDRRLPKHNARRAKQPRPQKTASDDRIVFTKDSRGEDTQEDNSGIGNLEILNVNETTNNIVQSENDFAPIVESSPFLKEVLHLLKRVKNVRESIQLSNNISNPNTYEENVLNAVANCLNEWRQIQKRYPPQSEDDDEKSVEKRKQASLEVFQLIQYSIQCGPMAGGKPGYFKRCGSKVAYLVHEYLATVIQDLDASKTLGFTEKQAKAIETWKSNAQKAVDNNKPPSKSQLKKQSKQKKKK